VHSQRGREERADTQGCRGEERLQQEEERLKEEEERLQKEEAEQLRGKTEDEGQRVLEEAEAGAEAAAKDKEDGEVAQAQPADDKEKPKDKEFIRIDASAASPASVNQSRRWPGPLDLSHASRREPVTPSFPSALATARIIEDID
jgi:hypothetical protein